MAAIPDNRRRLADLMERRRVELGLRWKEVAEAGGISYEVIRAVRNGEADIRALTKHGIDVGLQWKPGSVQSILDGGDPSPAESAPPATPAPSLAAVPDADSGGTVFDIMRSVFTDPLERVIWDTTWMSEDMRREKIEELRAKRAELAGELERRENNGARLTVAGTLA